MVIFVIANGLRSQDRNSRNIIRLIRYGIRLMKTANTTIGQVVATMPSDTKQEIALEVAISNRIYELMTKRGLSKVKFAQALGKRPSEITKWLSGQHNFTIRTISLLSVFFDEDLIKVDNK